MKRIISLLLVCAISLSLLAGCGEPAHTCEFGRWKVDEEATCEKEGVEVRKCDCGEKEERAIAKLEHKYTSTVTTEATCLAEGLTTFTCENCKDTYTEKIAILDHSYSSTVTTPASCQQEGVKTYTCAGCNNTYTEPITRTTYSSTELPVMLEASVGEVTTYNKKGEALGLGTCFVQTADGVLITNYHVIDGAYSAKVALAGKTYDVAQVLAYDVDIDIAILKIAATGLKPVTLCKLDHKTGETVYAYGSSKGLTLTFSSGLISAAPRTIAGVKYVQHEAPISNGNSGGPLINVYGEVIGINTMYVIDGQNLNFAIHLSELDNLDYSSPMTMAQVYEKECDPFKLLAEAIIASGLYDDADNYYVVSLGTTYSSDYKHSYTREAYYYPNSNQITLDMIVDNGDYYCYLTLDSSLSGYYRWDYFDDADYEMYGYLSAGSFTQNSTLSYSGYDNIPTSALVSSVRNLATSLVKLPLLAFESDFGSIGVTLDDLGFTSF